MKNNEICVDEYHELEIEIIGEVSPAEAQEQFYPGCAASVDVLTVWAKGNGKEMDITSLLTEKEIKEYEEVVLERYEE